MKNRLHSITFLASVALVFAVAFASSPLQAQQSSPSSQYPSSQSQTTPGSQMPSSQSPAQASPDQTGTPGAQPGQVNRAPDTAAPSADPSAVQTFIGTVVKQGDKYVLQDASGKTYGIDHQAEVSKFEGKKIRVHGTLDPSGKMIHAQ